MNQIYLDNAATTSVRPEVVEEMVKILTNDFGNPSSTYSIGRHTKALIEASRKTIAKQFNVTASEIIFTSCGTEGNNWIIRSSVRDLGIKKNHYNQNGASLYLVFYQGNGKRIRFKNRLCESFTQQRNRF